MNGTYFKTDKDQMALGSCILDQAGGFQGISVFTGISHLENKTENFIYVYTVTLFSSGWPSYQLTLVRKP